LSIFKDRKMSTLLTFTKQIASSGLGSKLGLAAATLASVGLVGCATPYHPSGVVYAPAPTPGTAGAQTYPSAQAPAANQSPQVVRSVQVPQNQIPPNGGLSVAEILTQSKGGRPSAELIADITSRGLNAPLKQADIDLMATNAVPKEIVDAALAAPVNTATVDNPQVVTRSYYHYPWVPFTLGLYWGAWRPYYYPYYSYAPRYYGYSAPRYYGGGGHFGGGHSRGWSGGWGGGWGHRGGRFR
jgi:hypothetical protein